MCTVGGYDGAIAADAVDSVVKCVFSRVTSPAKKALGYRILQAHSTRRVNVCVGSGSPFSGDPALGGNLLGVLVELEDGIGGLYAISGNILV